MRQDAGHWLMLATIAGMLTACTTEPPPIDPNLAPVDYKKEIITTLTTTLTDPTNVRDAFISEPVLTKVGTDQRYTACVRYNARDANRRYTGSTARIAYFYAGHLNQLVEATKEQCGSAAYQAFPELEKLCLATKCN
jgi:hypothetical protein